jgi:class 3 adenylate cyclase
MDVTDWLRSLGLQQYEALFQQNDIDANVLPTLEADDLRELGISSLGHRKKLLAAIAALADHSKVAATPDQIQEGRAPASSSAERRQLTVMFCDLVGSTQLSTQLDPEDMGDLIRAFQREVAAAVAPFDGHVAKLMGDGALVYFGYPRAHEDDAERAVRAGLTLVERVQALGRERGLALEVRAGIATGRVVVGELIGEGEARERGVVGETPNLAARLQALAEPGEVVVAEATRRLLGGAFDLRALGPQVLKGFAAPVSAWAIEREADNLSRFEASRPATLTPFVGRQHELALVLDRWRDAVEGEGGQVVLLSGEAGIGKSRILATLREQISGERHIVLRYQCSPHHVNDAFYPIIGQIRHAAGLLEGDPPATRLDKLETMIALSGVEAQDTAPYLASLLSVPTEGRYFALEMAPSEVKERSIAALMGLFVGLTKSAPVLALLEDAHWIDPTSLDVFSRLVEALQGVRALLVITFRPEFAAPWVGRANVTALALNRFGRRPAVTMIDGLTGGKAMPAEVLDQIVAKTDGVPLFVEELTKTVLESGLLREANGSYVLATPLTPLAIPSTLQDSLMERLDRSAPIKEIAQIGAAIGREFPYRLLEAVSPIKGIVLQEALGRLIASELVYGRGEPPEASYTFKHVLVQETAYASLLKSRRQQLHQRIAGALVALFPQTAEAEPDVLARHYAEAGLDDEAASNFARAGQRALARSAQPEAVVHLQQALKFLSQLPPAIQRDERELSLLLSLGQALFGARGGAAPETEAAFARAKELAIRSGDPDAVRRASYGIFIGATIAGRLDRSLAIGRELLSFAERTSDDETRIVADRILGGAYALTGDLLSAEKHLSRTIGLSRLTPPLRGDTFAHDPAKTAPATLAHVRWSRGFPEQAQELVEGALHTIDQRSEANTAGFLMIWAGLLGLLMREPQAALEHAQNLSRFAEKRGSRFWQTVAEWIEGAALVALEQPEAGLERLTSAFQRFAAMGGTQHEPFFRCFEAQACLRLDRPHDSERSLARAHQCLSETKQRFYEPPFLLGSAALLLFKSKYRDAEALLLETIEFARIQQSKSWELRAATSLARLWREEGRRAEANALLAPIYGWFSEGFNTPDLLEAKALLDELAD